jgi:hypothetical protein
VSRGWDAAHFGGPDGTDPSAPSGPNHVGPHPRQADLPAVAGVNLSQFPGQCIADNFIQSRLVFAVTGLAVDVSLENVRGLEDHDPALIDGHLNPSLGIATDALTLVADDERAEPGELHGLTGGKAVANLT